MLNQAEQANKMIASRKQILPEGGFNIPNKHGAAEGGCGVIGMASSEQIAAKHMLQSLIQMRNRGNGKGGGIAAAGLVPEEFGISQKVLDEDYLLVIAYLDKSVRTEVEREYVESAFEIDHQREQPAIKDYKSIDELDVEPPFVVHYFVRPKMERLDQFAKTSNLEGASQRDIEDEYVYQNSFKLNSAYYSSEGEKQAFVLSHGKNLLVLKMVGYGDDVIRYYQLEDIHAHVWIGHHRYPTKGLVWHPGGAHPFIGLNEALVHNGDFANYASITEYLSQHNIYPLFVTDTEVSVQVFDLLHRTYKYPLEYVIESLAPTTERDFTQLPADKQNIYKMLQTTHMHASPDGPWFFLIAQSERDKESNPVYRLTGITDTSMLRPQVFAWQEREEDDGSKVSIGFAASEKQAIDAALGDLASEDNRFWSHADRYWNARGGSHTDGGAFMFSVSRNGSETAKLELTDKFGKPVNVPTSAPAYMQNGTQPNVDSIPLPDLSANELYSWATKKIPSWSYEDINSFLVTLRDKNISSDPQYLIDILTLLIDRRYNTGDLRRSSLLTIFSDALIVVFDSIQSNKDSGFAFASASQKLPTLSTPDQKVVIDAQEYAPEGRGSLAEALQKLYANGFRQFIIHNVRGHRFIANGLGPNTAEMQIDVYGSPGDYLASGIDGVQLNIHANGQDQLAQIMKSGKLVVHGDVGQTFMYGAKGGEAYILGNAAGRPLINAVGGPRVVINGTCLDYLAESFMAGDPHNGGGFVIVNGIEFGEDASILDLDSPYPGGNLYSLASGGAIYMRDPHNKLSNDQLNGGEFAPFSDKDWEIIKPYLEENERLFGIPIKRLLSIDGVQKEPGNIYRKIQPGAMRALQAEEVWVTKHE